VTAYFSDEMWEALEADGEKLRQLTGENHGPWFLETCPDCDGFGTIASRVTVYEHGCAFSHDDTDECPCATCDGFGTVITGS
jgi:hypothetical protein